MLTASLAVVLTCLLPTIWVVDASNGPGTNFTDLPAAIAAAASGDTILVRSGTYTCFSVSGKALTIRGAGAATTTVSVVPLAAPFGPTIDNVPAGGTLYVGGLTLWPQPNQSPSSPGPPIVAGLHVLGPTTRVVLSDAVIQGTFVYTGLPPMGSSNSTPGLYVASGAEVHASRCTFTASYGSTGGGAGAFVYGGGTLAAEGSTFTGGSACTATGFASSGPGLSVGGGTVTTARSSFFGGIGGGYGIIVTPLGSGVGGFLRMAAAATDTVQPGGPSLFCTSSQGYALYVAPGSSAVVHGVPTVILPSPGAPVMTGAVTAGPPLPHLSITGSATAAGELVATQPVTVTFDGLIPFALFAGIVDLAPSFSTAYAPVLLGEMLVAPPGAGAVQGTLDALGMWQTTVTPAVSLSLVGVPIYAQFGVLDATGQVRLSNAPVRVFN